MPSRRQVLITMAAGLTAPAVASVRALAARSQQASRGEITTALNGTVGLQLWSLRKQLPTALRPTLVAIHDMGFRTVEGAGLWKHSAGELREALDGAGLKCLSAHVPLERLRDDRAKAFAEAKAVGATWIVCPWIANKDNGFTADDAARSAEAFNTIAKAADAEGLRFAYHCHGYEFVPASPEGKGVKGTLFDTLASSTDPKLVLFQIDVFHALLGGADPVALIKQYQARVKSLHLKDLKKGFPIKAGTPIAPAEADVPIGTGQVDMPAVLRAAMQAGVQQFYIEDESDDPLGHIPQSVAFLERFKP
jgi:sugar phosphate isomerase/epimerase